MMEVDEPAHLIEEPALDRATVMLPCLERLTPGARCRDRLIATSAPEARGSRLRL